MTEAAPVEFSYRGRQVSQEDVLYIRALIERHPNQSRRTLSATAVRSPAVPVRVHARRERRDSGLPRSLLLMLERAGQTHVAVPGRKRQRNPAYSRLAKRRLGRMLADQTPIGLQTS